ncbi:MAG: DUF4159 domain-containing protein [Cyclobacteriaceae bacterium]
MLKHLILCVFTLAIVIPGQGQNLKIARLKYGGGGDWYANKTALPNLLRYCKKELFINLNEEEDIVEPSSKELFNYPYVYLTGHGNVVFSSSDVQNLRQYLMSGGFLHVDDNYGMDPFIRPELKKIFPESELIELPATHPIYQQKFKFPKGLPKIHEHDGKPSQGFGIFFEGRLVIFYSYECDLGNGWEDQRIHNDPEQKRLEALRMGANLISYCFLNP